MHTYDHNQSVAILTRALLLGRLPANSRLPPSPVVGSFGTAEEESEDRQARQAEAARNAGMDSLLWLMEELLTVLFLRTWQL